MKTVKIYKITCTNSFILSDRGEGFALEPWGCNTVQIQGYDDGGKNYILPAGYDVANIANQHGKGIFRGNIHCHIAKHSSGRPQLIGDNPLISPVLKRS